MADQQQDAPQQQVAAFIEEAFVPATVSLEEQEAQPGVPARVKMKLFAGPTPTAGVFMFCYLASFEPKTALAVGEALVESARHVGVSGIEIPAVGALPDLRAARG